MDFTWEQTKGIKAAIKTIKLHYLNARVNKTAPGPILFPHPCRDMTLSPSGSHKHANLTDTATSCFCMVNINTFGVIGKQVSSSHQGNWWHSSSSKTGRKRRTTGFVPLVWGDAHKDLLINICCQASRIGGTIWVWEKNQDLHKYLGAKCLLFFDLVEYLRGRSKPLREASVIRTSHTVPVCF